MISCCLKIGSNAHLALLSFI